MEHSADGVPSEHSMLDEATDVLMSAFQKEALTTALLPDLSQKRHRGLYSKTVISP